MNTEMQSIWFYSTPKEFRESIYFKILIDNNIEVGINENSFTEMLIRIYENYITILEDGEIGGMYLVDNEIFMDVFNYISCQNTLIAYSKDKIDYLTNRLPKTQTTQPTPPQKEIKPIDNTLHQQFLIFHYLFKHLEISTNSIDKTQIARFIQFATQKQLEAKKIQNTSIYKLVDNPFNGYKKEQGTTQTNLQKVRELFESIGLKEIAEMVSKDII